MNSAQAHLSDNNRKKLGQVPLKENLHYALIGLQLRRQNTCILSHDFSSKNSKGKYVRPEHVTSFCSAVGAVKELWSVQPSLHGRVVNKPVMQSYVLLMPMLTGLTLGFEYCTEEGHRKF